MINKDGADVGANTTFTTFLGDHGELIIKTRQGDHWLVVIKLRSQHKTRLPGAPSGHAWSRSEASKLALERLNQGVFTDAPNEARRQLYRTETQALDDLNTMVRFLSTG